MSVHPYSIKTLGLALVLAGGLIATLQADEPRTDRPGMTTLDKNLEPFRYREARVPFYAPGKKWGSMGAPIKQMQMPLEPAEALKHLVHPVDFERKLFAAEPNFGGKPIALNWDERGRLWVAVTVDYPNELQKEGAGRDRIVICEDTDGDGLADKFTIFADKLSIPTSLIFARGGVIVQQAPHTLFLKDSNGDDVADERRVLFTGWSTRDTHAGPSNLRYGLDNWIWGIVGYSGFDGKAGGDKHSFRQGFYRFQADGSRLEFLRSTSNNSWGLGFSEEGLVFGSTANGNPSVYLPIPNRYYEQVRGWSASVLGTIADSAAFEPITDKVRQVDHHGKFTAAAGHALYTARAYPRAYWNRAAFVSDPTGHLTATLVLERQGADVRSRYGWNLLASDDEWCAPIAAEVGPDGNVWNIDWYNYIVQHNPTPAGFKTGKGSAYETDLRDKKHGRVYRLAAKNQKPQAPVSLKDAGPDKLVATLRNDNMFWRLHAQRLLVERGQRDVLPALIEIARDGSVDDIGLNSAVIHALWTMHGLGALDGTHADASRSAVAALKHKSAGVRRNAVAVLPGTRDSLSALLESGVLDDADGQARLAALLALSNMPADTKAAEKLVALLGKPENNKDRWLADAMICAAAAHDLPFLKALAAGQTRLDPQALKIAAVVAEHYARGGPADSAGTLLVALADAEPGSADAVLAGLAKGWPKNRSVKLHEESEKALAKLMTRLPAGSKAKLLQLAALWGTTALDKNKDDVVRTLIGVLANEKKPEEDRLAAARQALELSAGAAKIVEQCLELVSPKTAPELSAGILDALGASPSARIAPALIQRLSGWPPALRGAALRVLLRRPESTRLLLDALEKGEIQRGELALDQQQSLLAHPDARIAARAKKLLEQKGGLPSPDREAVLQKLLPLARRQGDADLGTTVFKNQCAKCHRHNGEGNSVGPDLTGMAVHSKEHLLTEILDPNRSVEGNYRVYDVEAADGRILNGLLASETRTSLELIDAEGKKLVIQRDNIERLTASPRSLMPEGFEKQLSEADLANLLEFLTRPGKYLPLPLDKAATVVSTQGMFTSRSADAERLIFPDWSPKVFANVPFILIDPRGDRVPNVILLHGPQGTIPPALPKSVRLPCNIKASAIHLLGGVSGWGHPHGEKGSVSLIVRLHYEDGTHEDHPLKNGEHCADYLHRVDVPGSQFAFRLRNQQVRYLALKPQGHGKIKEIELIKGPDATAPIVMAVTVEVGG